MNERRRPFSRYVDEEGVSRLSINPKTWTGVLGLVGTILTTSTIIAGIVLSMLKPVVTGWIRDETRPAQLEMAATIDVLARDFADSKRTSVSRQELEARMERMEIRLDDIYRLLANGERGARR